MTPKPLDELLILLSNPSTKDASVESHQNELVEATKGVTEEKLQQAAETAARASHSLESWKSTVDALMKFKGPLVFKRAQGVVFQAFLRTVISNRPSEILSDKAQYVSHLADRISFLEHCVEEYGHHIPSEVAVLKDNQTCTKYLANGTILSHNAQTTCVEGEVVGAEAKLVILRISEKAADTELLSVVEQIAAKVKGDICIKVISSFEDQDSERSIVVTEHYGISLQKAIEQQQKLSHRQVHQIFNRLATAVNEVHSAGFVLGNLNLSNVMISIDKSNGNLSAKISLDSHLNRGVIGDVKKCDKIFVAPEVLKTSKCSRHGDIYAVGGIMSTVLLRFLGIGSSEVVSKLQQQDPYYNRSTAIGAQGVSKLKSEIRSACRGEWKPREYFEQKASQIKTATDIADVLQKKGEKINKLKKEKGH